MSAAGLRVAIAGAGVMGHWHAAAARRAGASLVAVVDPDRARADRLNGETSHRRLDDALSTCTVDVVHVCTPVETHASLVRDALGAGSHVVVEKPLAADEATTAALLELAAETRRLLVPVHQFLFQDGFRYLAGRLSALGTIVDVGLVAATAGSDVAGAAPDILVDEILPHPLALFERLLPASVGGAWSARRPAPGELRASTAHGETTLWIALTTRGRPTRNELIVTGTAGTARLDLFHGFAIVQGGGVSRARKVAAPFLLGSSTVARAGLNATRRAIRRETAYPGLWRLIEETYAAVVDGGEVPIPPAEARAVAAARDAIIRASGS